MKKAPLSYAIKAALSATLLAGVAVPSFAQVEESAVANEAAEEEMVEEVYVTGSRIKRPDLDNANPVTVVSREDMVVTGVTDVGDLIQRMPAASGSPIGTTTNNGGNGGVYVDLRGLGSIRTLNLVNGKRTVDGGDYQAIPSAMIERVEILKDGASAVYGADAVSGVVNVITRQDFDGVEINYQTSDSFEVSAGKQDSISFIAGADFDRGHAVFGAEYVRQEEALQGDYPWAHFETPYVVDDAACLNGDGVPTAECLFWGSSRIPEGFIRTSAGDIFMNENNAGLVPWDGRYFNYNPYNYMQTPYSKLNVFSEASFELNNTTRLYAEVRATHRSSAQLLAPMPYSSGNDPAYVIDPVSGATGASRDNYYWNKYYQEMAANNPSLDPTTPDVVDLRRRVLETERKFEQEVSQVQFTFGVTGEVGFGDWTYDAYVNQGYRQSLDTDLGQFFGPNLRNALGPSADLDGDGTPECYADINDPTTLIAGCVPMDMFGGAGTMTPEMIAYVSTPLSDFQRAQQGQYALNFAGTLIGDVGVAVGAERRTEEYVNRPDSTKVMGEVTGNKGEGTTGDFSVTSYYVEAYVPVFDNGSQSLTFDLGARFDDYSTFGSNTSTQVKVDAQLFEGLRLRATYGDVFRAPGIDELFGGRVDSFPSYSDPCDPTKNASGVRAPYCAQDSEQLDTQVLAKTGGNPTLQPETGYNYTAGVVYEPGFDFADVTVTVDYWNIYLEDVISGYGAQSVLNSCYEDGDQFFCDLVTRRGDYSIKQVDTLSINLAEMEAAGIDLQLNVGMDIGPGRLDTSLLWARQLKNERKAYAGAEVQDLVGAFNDNSTYAEDKANVSVAYTVGAFSISYLGEYISETESPWYFLDGNQTIDAQYYSDIVGAVNFEDMGTRLSVGVTNVTNEFPPYIEDGFNGNTDPSAYRVAGRSWYLRLTQSF